MRVHEEPDGDWVRWEDVEALINERDQLVQQNHRLVGRIDELKAGDP